MIFNYFINNDMIDINNSIMLCIDNEIESSISEGVAKTFLEKYIKKK